MKKILLSVFIAFAALTSSFAFSDANYPFNSPVYVPSAVSPAVNYTAPTEYVVTLQNGGVIGVDINGTCTSLAAVMQVSVDGTTWRTINVYPIATTTTAAASISAAGGYRANVSGARAARVHVTALTASCNISAVVTSGSISPAL